MINFNGIITEKESFSQLVSRGFQYGDAIFETMKVKNSKILYWEDHYFRLMASMRILRMEIPMNFTMEFLESNILKTVSSNQLDEQTARVKFYVERSSNGFYFPEKNGINYFITVHETPNNNYVINNTNYEVDLFKDYFIAPSLLSTLKTNNRITNVLSSIFAKENRLDNCLLLNTNKQVIEATNGNLFLVTGNTIKTPPLLDGCLKGIMRKQVIDIVNSIEDYELQETSISPFELQKADALFITNVIIGIQPITKYRKKVYSTVVIYDRIVAELNQRIN